MSNVDRCILHPLERDMHSESLLAHLTLTKKFHLSIAEIKIQRYQFHRMWKNLDHLKTQDLFISYLGKFKNDTEYLCISPCFGWLRYRRFSLLLEPLLDPVAQRKYRDIAIRMK